MFSEQIKQAIIDQKKCQICANQSKIIHDPQFELIDLSQYQGIIQYQPEELVITVKAGTTLAEINHVLAKNNQYLPFEPPDYGHSTIGGSYALALSGAAKPFRGSLRDHVLGVKIIDGKGQTLTFGGQMMKNVAGYDVSRLLVGSKGMLAVISDISFKILPLETTQTYALEIAELEAIQLMNQWAGSQRPLTACAYFDGLFYYRLAGIHSPQTANPVDATIWQKLHPFKMNNPANLWRVDMNSSHPPLDNTLAIDWCGARRWITSVDKPLFDFVQSANFQQSIKEQTHPKFFNQLKDIFDPHHLFNLMVS